MRSSSDYKEGWYTNNLGLGHLNTVLAEQVTQPLWVFVFLSVKWGH